MFPFKKFKKIVFLSVLFLILVGSVVFLLFSLSIVQTEFAQRITKNLNKIYDTNISIEKAFIQLNGDVFVKNILIRDHHQDSLLFVKELKTSINGLNRFLEKDYNFYYIGLIGAELSVIQYSGESESSLQYFINKLKDTTGVIKAPFIFRSDVLEINSSDLVIQDLNILNSKKSFSDIDLGLNDFDFKNDKLSLAVNSLKASSDQYGKINSFKATISYNKDSLITKDFELKLNKNNLKGESSISFLGGNLANLTPSFFEIHLDDSTINLSDLTILESSVKKSSFVKASFFITGKLNEFDFKLKVKDLYQSSFSGNIHVLNLLDKENFKVSSSDFKISTSDKALRNIFNNDIYNQFRIYSSKADILNIDSKFFGDKNNLKIQLNTNSKLGIFNPVIKLKRNSKNQNWNYNFNLEANNFDIGEILDINTLLKVSALVSIDGYLKDSFNFISSSRGLFRTIQIGSRNLDNIKFNSSTDINLTSGLISSDNKKHDFYIDFLIDHSKNTVQTKGNLNRINLSEFNLADNESNVILSSSIDIKKINNFEESNLVIQLEKPVISSNERLIQFKDLILISNIDKLEKSILIQDSDAISFLAKGNFNYKNITRLINGVADDFLISRNSKKVIPKESFDFDIHLKSKLTEALFPNLFTPDDFFLSGSISSQVKESAVAFDIPILLFKNYTFKGLHFEFDSSNSIYTSFLSADEIRIGSFQVNELFMISSPLKNKNQIRVEGILNGKFSNSFATNLNYTIINEFMKFDINKFDLKSSNGSWSLPKDDLNKFSFDSESKTFNLNPISLINSDQKIEIAGNYKSNNEFDFQINSKNVFLNEILPKSLNYEIQGNLNTSISFYKTPLRNDASLEINIDNLLINELEMGDLDLSSFGNTSLNSYKTSAVLIDDGIERLNFSGGVLIHQKRTTLDLDFQLNEFDMSFLSSLGKDKIRNFTSLLSGDFNLWGPIYNLSHSGKLSLDNFNITVPYTNMSYGLKDGSQLTLFDQEIKFESTSFFDQIQGTTSKLKGSISHINFKDWGLDMNINTNRLLLINKENKKESVFYGTGFLEGNIHIHGPTKNLIMDVDGSTAEGTSIIIPWEENKSLADISFIDFISKAKLEKSIIEVKKKNYNEIMISRGLEMTFDLDINTNAKFEIVVDQISGSTITGRGSGNILMETNTDNKFNMWGDFIAYDGIYNFKNFGLIDKKFNVNSGGTIIWEGDPLEAQMNIEAVYEVPGGANPALLVDNPNFNKKIPTNVLIKLEGSLLKPDNPLFEISFPNTSGIVASEINYRLADEQRRQLQAISLLSQGIFVSDVSFSTQGIANNLYEKASDVITSLLGESDGKLDFGLNYLKGDSRQDLDTRSQDRIGITFVTQISDKVLLNGKIGVPVGGVEETLIVGDVQIDFILNEEGTLKAKVFNKENEFRYISDDLGYTQGVGLSYQVDFKTFEGLIQKIITKRSRTQN